MISIENKRLTDMSFIAEEIDGIFRIYKNYGYLESISNAITIRRLLESANLLVIIEEEGVQIYGCLGANKDHPCVTELIEQLLDCDILDISDFQDIFEEKLEERWAQYSIEMKELMAREVCDDDEYEAFKKDHVPIPQSVREVLSLEIDSQKYYGHN